MMMEVNCSKSARSVVFPLVESNILLPRRLSNGFTRTLVAIVNDSSSYNAIFFIIVPYQKPKTLNNFMKA